MPLKKMVSAIYLFSLRTEVLVNKAPSRSKRLFSKTYKTFRGFKKQKTTAWCQVVLLGSLLIVMVTLLRSLEEILIKRRRRLIVWLPSNGIAVTTLLLVQKATILWKQDPKKSYFHRKISSGVDLGIILYEEDLYIRGRTCSNIEDKQNIFTSFLSTNRQYGVFMVSIADYVLTRRCTPETKYRVSQHVRLRLRSVIHGAIQLL